ncbi:MAG: addiction module component CHP02574 family protein [Chthoniobacterales bacterium]|nr:MAG: addiction module component CHP02574 family protein [Chthoniobacterales bacterium]
MSVAEMKQELSRLTNAERIELMNAIWASLDNKDEALESPTWHREVLAEREARIRSGEAQFLSLDEVKKRFSH